jgi:acetyl esterase/lipase
MRSFFRYVSHWIFVCLFLLLGFTVAAFAEGWGTPVTQWHMVTNNYRYTVYRSNFVYHPVPFHITDLRTDDTSSPPLHVYSDKSDFETRSIDVYRAFDGTHFLIDQPVVVYVHGGAWVDGYRSWYDFVAQPFTGARGWVTVVVDYRLTSSNVFLANSACSNRTDCPDSPERIKAAWYPDNIDDVAAAFQWVKDHIAEHGGNPNWMVLFGHSAGAHLVSLLATHTNYAPAAVPYLRGVVSMSGLYSHTNLNYALLFSNEVAQTFHGGLTNTPLLAEASPAAYVKPGATIPSFYILYGQTLYGELPGLTEQGILFYNRLKFLGFEVTNTQFGAEYDHSSEMGAIAYTNELATHLILGYMDKVLYQSDLNTNNIIDWWEIQHFGSLTHVTQSSDQDHDGSIDRSEYLAGTDPTNAASYFHSTEIAPSNSNQWIVRWLSAANKSYAVARSSNLLSGFSVIASNLAAAPPENSYTDITDQADTRLYRIELQP